ncbi:MAG: hypothetical protein Q9207_008423, partial [Kuettlingeria erythrocarpa]
LIMPALPVTVVTTTGNETLPVIISTLLNISDVLNNPTLTKMDKTFWVAGMYYTVFAFGMYALYIGYLIFTCHRHYHPRHPSRADHEYEEDCRIKQVKGKLGYDSSVDLSEYFEYNPSGFGFHSELSTLVDTQKSELFAEDASGLMSVEKYGHDKKSLSTGTCADHDDIRDCFPGCTDTLIDGTVVEDAPLVRNLTITAEDFSSKQIEGLGFEPNHPRSVLRQFQNGEDCKEHGSYHIDKVDEALGCDSIAELPWQLAYKQNGSLPSPDECMPADLQGEVAVDFQTPKELDFPTLNFRDCSLTQPREVTYDVRGFSPYWMHALLDGIVHNAGHDSSVVLEQNVVVTPYGFSYFPAESIQFVKDEAVMVSENDDGRRFDDLMEEFRDSVREDVASWCHTIHCGTSRQGGICQSCIVYDETPNFVPGFLLPTRV